MRSIARASALLARYVVWLVLSGLWMWAILEVRINVIDLTIWFGASRWALPAIDKFLTVPLILVWLILALWLEHYLTAPADAGVFRGRAARVSAVVLAVLGLSYILQVVIV